jgi:hypothetical protein
MLGCCRVSHVFWQTDSACLFLIFCKFLVFASGFVLGAHPLVTHLSLSYQTDIIIVQHEINLQKQS